MNDLLVIYVTGTLALTLGLYLTLQNFGLGLRYWQLKTADERQAHRDAARIRRTWPRLMRNLGLSLTDHMPRLADSITGRKVNESGRLVRPRIHLPRMTNIEIDTFGITATIRLVPTVGLEHFEKHADQLANFWGMVRVHVIQQEPNKILMRAVRRDPLTLPLTVSTPRAPRDLRYYPAGLDEFGKVARVRLHHGSGIGVYGLPTYGKSSFILGLISYFAMSDRVQFLVADGKVETGHEGDYYDVAPRALSIIGSDVLTFNEWIKQVNSFRAWRAGVIRQALGTKDFWEVGPTPEWPLIFVIIDEAHSFFDQVKTTSKNTDLVNQNTKAAENAHEVAKFVRLCRSVGMELVISTQKGTSDAIPTQIRDNLHASISFAVKTDEAAIAALGQNIRDYPDANPTNYQAEQYIGVASMVAERRKGFVRMRTPLCKGAIAAAVCDQSAHLVRPMKGVSVGLGHRALAPASPAALLPDTKDAHE